MLICHKTTDQSIEEVKMVLLQGGINFICKINRNEGLCNLSVGGFCS